MTLKEEIQKLIGRKVRLIIRLSDTDLNYTAVIEKADDDSFSFTDKFNEKYSYRYDVVSCVNPIGNDDQNGKV